MPIEIEYSISNSYAMPMNPDIPEEKVKPFRLVKYFTITSIIVVFLGTIVLSILNTHWTREMQRQKSQEYAVLMVENLNHQIFSRFIVPVAIKYGRVQLRDKEQYELMDKIVRITLHSFKVDMVNIYDLANIISYSFNSELIGIKNAGGAGYKNAISGRSTFQLIQRGNFWENILGIPKEIKLKTIAPLRAEKRLAGISGPVLGVIEIVQDLSDEYKTIFKFQIFVVITSAVVMGALLLVLIFVVKRGENIIQQRALERRKLEEQLSRAQHLSSLGEMAAGISHEIRNPLGIISSAAELLKKKIADVDPNNTIPNVIVEETGRLNNIITDFINYARPKTPNLSPSHVDEVIEKNLNFLDTQLSEKGYRVSKNFENNLPDIMADSAMLYQAFLNILINAMQAMPEGGEIRVNVRANNNIIIITFDDDGEGIPDDILTRVWEPFFTTKEKGTGLGLGIVKNIIEAHGGDIHIRNKSERGVRVIIELPVIQEVHSWRQS